MGERRRREAARGLLRVADLRAYVEWFSWAGIEPDGQEFVNLWLERHRAAFRAAAAAAAAPARAGTLHPAASVNGTGR